MYADNFLPDRSDILINSSIHIDINSLQSAYSQKFVLSTGFVIMTNERKFPLGRHFMKRFCYGLHQKNKMCNLYTNLTIATLLSQQEKAYYRNFLKDGRAIRWQAAVRLFAESLDTLIREHCPLARESSHLAKCINGDLLYKHLKNVSFVTSDVTGEPFFVDFDQDTVFRNWTVAIKTNPGGPRRQVAY